MTKHTIAILVIIAAFIICGAVWFGCPKRKVDMRQYTVAPESRCELRGDFSLICALGAHGSAYLAGDDCAPALAILASCSTSPLDTLRINHPTGIVAINNNRVVFADWGSSTLIRWQKNDEPHTTAYPLPWKPIGLAADDRRTRVVAWPDGDHPELAILDCAIRSPTLTYQRFTSRILSATFVNTDSVALLSGHHISLYHLTDGSSHRLYSLGSDRLFSKMVYNPICNSLVCGEFDGGTARVLSIIDGTYYDISFAGNMTGLSNIPDTQYVAILSLLESPLRAFLSIYDVQLRRQTANYLLPDCAIPFYIDSNSSHLAITTLSSPHIVRIYDLHRILSR